MIGNNQKGLSTLTFAALAKERRQRAQNPAKAGDTLVLKERLLLNASGASLGPGAHCVIESVNANNLCIRVSPKQTLVVSRNKGRILHREVTK